MKLDHVTIRAADIEGTRRFLQSVLDVKVGYRPPFSFPGYWLYSEGDPVIHLIPGHEDQVDYRGDIIDHVGFLLQGYAAHRRKLDALDIKYTTMDLPDIGERRLFLRTPSSVLLELVFREAPPVPALG